jgi:hypothetical protein
MSRVYIKYCWFTPIANGSAEGVTTSCLDPFRSRQIQLQIMQIMAQVAVCSHINTHFLLSWLKQLFSCFLSTSICLVSLALQTRFPASITDRLFKSQSGQTARMTWEWSRFVVPLKTATSVTHFQRNSIHFSDPLR